MAFKIADSAYVIDNSKAMGKVSTILVKEGNTIITTSNVPAIISNTIKIILGNIPDSYTVKMET